MPPSSQVSCCALTDAGKKPRFSKSPDPDFGDKNAVTYIKTPAVVTNSPWLRKSYPGYRLAVDTLLGESGKSKKALCGFLKHVADTQGCPGAGQLYGAHPAANTGWKTAFDHGFGTDLRGCGFVARGFRAVASKYAR